MEREGRDKVRVVPIILCGGSGTRLWPVSRRELAKQHVPILGGPSPFERTLRRVEDTEILAPPMVMTGASGHFLVAEQAARMGVPVQIVVEPVSRDTLPAIAAATEIVARRNVNAMILVLPSDHLIPDQAAFAATVQQAAAAASEGRLAVIGLPPTGPETGYGYIRPGANLAAGVREVTAFEEKPDAERALALVAAGCLWNAGMFCFRVDAGREVIAKLAPAAATAVATAVDEAHDDLGALRLGDTFVQAPRSSFDYAIMEKTNRAVMVTAGFAWSDIGDWAEIWRQSSHDGAGNALEGRVVVSDVRHSYIRAENRLVCALGVENLAIVDTPDALLVAPLDRTQEIKTLVAALAVEGYGEATSPARVHRPWGWYQTMDLGEQFRVKRIHVHPSRRLSLQKHHHRAEHWVVVYGTAEVTRDEECFLLHENQSAYLPIGCVHRLANPGRIPLELIEVQTGSYLDEDDIVRLDDDFGRESR